MPEVSNRGTQMPASPIRKLVPFADAAKAEGVKVYHLNIGQPDLPTPQKALDSLKHITRKTLEYSHSQGLLSLRETLCKYYRRFGVALTPEDMLITTGGSEALLFAFLACLDSGDEIIVTEPGYANYLGFAKMADVKVVSVTSHIENGFALPSAEEFEAAITPRTRAILICNPNNPTGYLYNREELHRLRDIVMERNLFLIVDEVYREFVYGDEPFESALTMRGCEENVVVVDSVSKRYSECGTRIGMLVTRNGEVRSTALKFAQARLSPPLLGQIVAEESIEGTAAYSRECFEEYKARRDFFIKGLNEIPGVYSPMPQGAFYTVVSLPVDDAEKFTKWCLTDYKYIDPEWLSLNPEYTGETVMFAPAAGFYGNPELGRKQVRMAYVLKVENLARCLAILRDALKKYNNQAQPSH